MGIDQSMFIYQPPARHKWNWPNKQLHRNYCCVLVKHTNFIALYYCKAKTVHVIRKLNPKGIITPLNEESQSNKQRIIIASVLRSNKGIWVYSQKRF